MAYAINKKIISYKVVNTEDKAIAEQAKLESQKIHLESMHENVTRPEILYGSTYKIKTPQSEHALNMDTEHEERRPYEVFINSKNMEHFQWVLALTRVISAVFRKGGDACFLVEELKSVFDPKGGYFKKGGVFMPSLVAEIGCTIEQHLKKIGMLQTNDMDNHQKQFLNAKRKEFEAIHSDTSILDETGSFPAKALLCGKCQTKALVLMDGCMTCLNCGDSKCG